VVKATVPVAEAARAHFDAGADHLALQIESPPEGGTLVAAAIPLPG
jgi:hypothetical protein